jgi:uridine phosphorylase
MNSIFSDRIWAGKTCYVTPKADFLHHNFDPETVDLGHTCLITFSSGLFQKVIETVPPIVSDFTWPYSTTPLRLCATKSGKRFAIHFPSYGGARIANSLEQLATCGIQYVIGLGLGGTPQDTLQIGDTVLLEGAIRGDGVSRYYSPIEYPAVADFGLTALLHRQLAKQHEDHSVGLSFGTDALYREEEHLVQQLRELGVLTIDLESSAFLTVGRRLGLKCSWLGVVSDRLSQAKHEGNIHSEHIMKKLLCLVDCILQVIESDL